MQKIVPCLWFEKEAHEAADYYLDVFPQSRLIDRNDFLVNLQLFGQRFMAMNGGVKEVYTNAVSFLIDCDGQHEIDCYWERFLEDGAQELRSGWIKDKYGVAWQIIPNKLGSMVNHDDRQKAMQVLQSLQTMKKIDLEVLQEVFKNS